jgi:hypothetical protein
MIWYDEQNNHVPEEFAQAGKTGNRSRTEETAEPVEVKRPITEACKRS